MASGMYLHIFSLFILFGNIRGESDNFYVKHLQNAISLTQNTNRLSATDSVKTEQIAEVERIKSTNFAELLFSQENQLFSDQYASDYNISEVCFHHLAVTVEALLSRQSNPWAQQMIDAFGKPGSGLFDGNFKWSGSFDECRKVQGYEFIENINESIHAFNGQYCSLTIPLQSAQLMGVPVALVEGICVPDTCSQMDISALVNSLLAMVPQGNTSTIALANCITETPELDSRAIVAITIICILGAFMIVGTAYDVIVLQWPRHQSGATIIAEKTDLLTEEHTPLLNNHKIESIIPEPEPKLYVKVLLAFSVYTNGKKILATNKPTGSITCIHGIRFLSMSWVVLGHSYGFLTIIGSNLYSYAPEILHRWSFQAIANALVSVDSFFTLSGLLVAYLTLKELDRKKGKINWFMFYFHRFWRLTPPYMLVLMVDVCLFRYFGNGPFWPPQGFEKNYCKDSWWQNLLYINNFFSINDMCMGWSWYLSNDMQFFVVSPLMLIPLFWSPVVGIIVCFVFLLGTMIAAGVISYQYNLSATLLGGAGNVESQAEYMDVYYVKPYCRIGPYVVGILTGYLLYKTKCRVRINKYINLAGWLLATFFALIVLYGLYDPDNTHPLSRSVAALYNATNKSVWGACLCWVIFACATGNGGFVNTLMSWSPFVALGRLTYCSYLVHLIIIYHFASAARSPLMLTDEVMIYLFLATLVLTNMVAFVTSLIFEAPMMGLEKVVFGRGK